MYHRLAGLAVLLCLGSAPVLAAGPQQDYVLYCMGCHGPTGHGVPGKVPPLAGSLTRFMRTAEGREYLLRVPGAANSPISDERLAGILNWAVQCFGDARESAGLAPFTAEEVADHRRHPLPDVLERRRAVVALLRATGAAPQEGY